jgi:copper homeostasis protein
MNLLCEVCVDSIESAINAEKGGASRIELCSNLFEGGITPSAGMILQVRKMIKIQMNVLIRPRSGDFCYSNEEFEVMKNDIEYCKKCGVDGVVFGILTIDGHIDIERNRILVELAQPLNVTFHRAFDMTCDPFKSMEDIISLKFQRILTSGQELSCLEGLDLLTTLIEKAKERIIIVPGGGITEKNIKKIIQTCKAKEFHVSGRIMHDSLMKYRNTKCYMGGSLRPSEFSLFIVDPLKIQHFIQNVSKFE